VLDYPALWRCFEDLGLESWRSALEPLLAERLQDDAHGDFRKWRQTLEALHAAGDDKPELRRELLLSLSPWRKGPFEVGGVSIDSEWRSNLKWERVKDALDPLTGRRVLDVGSGNGYYALRMREAGVKLVIGIDPTLLYVIQFLAIRRFDTDGDVHVLPLRLHELPGPSRAFDTAFSMGVLYHQRSPIDHLQQLRQSLIVTRECATSGCCRR
jgi:tRNA (mo5U34)-methyltransferase